MRILFDSHRQQYYRVCFIGKLVARLQNNSGNNRLVRLPELERLICENIEPVNNSWQCAELFPLTFNPN